jgi:hypothetical protein
MGGKTLIQLDGAAVGRLLRQCFKMEHADQAFSAPSIVHEST